MTRRPCKDTPTSTYDDRLATVCHMVTHEEVPVQLSRLTEKGNKYDYQPLDRIHFKTKLIYVYQDRRSNEILSHLED
jgi:hypothetical protein